MNLCVVDSYQEESASDCASTHTLTALIIGWNLLVQALEIKHMEKMDQLDSSKTKWGVEVETIIYFISVMLHDGAAATSSAFAGTGASTAEVHKRRSSRVVFPDETHMFAVAESKVGGEMVVRAHFTVDSPGNAMITATFAMAGFYKKDIETASNLAAIRQVDRWVGGWVMAIPLQNSTLHEEYPLPLSLALRRKVCECV